MCQADLLPDINKSCRGRISSPPPQVYSGIIEYNQEEQMEKLSSKTAKELRIYANEQGIDLGGATTKTKILSILLGEKADVVLSPVPEQTVITGPEPTKKNPESESASNQGNTIISTQPERVANKVEEKKKEDSSKVALFSEKNLRWSKVGQLSSGYNVVTKEAAEKWLTLPAVREASKEEVASYYGKS
jgi:hypothetical protein